MMTKDYSRLKINPQRFQSNFKALSQIGATTAGGVNRPAFSEAHLFARAWFREQILRSGLEFYMDGAANHSGVFRSSKANALTLLLGSHLDSVPHGGRFDGALGVLAALEVLQTVQESHIDLPYNLEAIDFTDEEGLLHGDFGSSALTGSLKTEELSSINGGTERLSFCLSLFGKSPEDLLSARRDPTALAGYLELHIEQGSRLKNSGIPIGIVTAIVGVGSYRIKFIGRADHAGTTSMQERRDAAQGAAAFIQAVRQLVIRDYPDSVANVVWLKTYPEALNIVPAEVELGLEFRSPDSPKLRELERALLALAKSAAQQSGLGLEMISMSLHEPIQTSEQMQELIRTTAHQMGFSTLDLISGAWHDAQMLAPICPTGMIFIPSENGSHSPLENADWNDCVRGANVLLQAALQASLT
jgi:beta-ureidopropionase / N-carbamoyl-L-amino-acid hydrolase